MNKKRVELWLAIAGLVVLAPGVVWFFSPRLNDADMSAAFASLARVPLDQIERTHSAVVSVTIPDTAHWRRMRRAWGDPGYLLAAESPTGLLYCLDELGIQTEATYRGRLVPAEKPDAPYGHSIECLGTIGERFRVPPGAEITIHVTATTEHPLPPGEVVLVPDWDWGTKDKIVGVMLDEDTRKVFMVTSGIGLILIVSAACLVARRNALKRRTMLADTGRTP